MGNNEEDIRQRPTRRPGNLHCLLAEADNPPHSSQEKFTSGPIFQNFCQLLKGRYLSVSAEFQRTDFEIEYTIQESKMLETFLSVIYILDLIGQSTLFEHVMDCKTFSRRGDIQG